MSNRLNQRVSVFFENPVLDSLRMKQIGSAVVLWRSLGATTFFLTLGKAGLESLPKMGDYLAGLRVSFIPVLKLREWFPVPCLNSLTYRDNWIGFMYSLENLKGSPFFTRNWAAWDAEGLRDTTALEVGSGWNSESWENAVLDAVPKDELSRPFLFYPSLISTSSVKRAVERCLARAAARITSKSCCPLTHRYAKPEYVFDPKRVEAGEKNLQEIKVITQSAPWHMVQAANGVKGTWTDGAVAEAVRTVLNSSSVCRAVIVPGGGNPLKRSQEIIAASFTIPQV